MTTENLLQPHHNHFNLIRLFAALQVVFFHSDALLPNDLSHPVILFLKKMLWFFPGVNIFFFISGFLVWRSLENAEGGVIKFFTKRIRRIYPGLIAVFLFVFFLMQLDNQFDDVGYFSKQMFKWLLAQFTLMQYMSLPNFRDYATGVPNGPLWSIATELQFYLILPLIYASVKRASLFRKNIVILTLCALSFVFNYYQEQLMEKGFPFRVLFFSMLNFFYFFGIGILIYLNFNRLHVLFIRFGKWVIAVFILCVLRWTYLERIYVAYDAKYFNLLVTLMLAMFVFSFAFLPKKKEPYFFQRNDFSYGLYLYHGPVINIIYTYGLRAWGQMIFWPLSITFALLSWYMIEQPFLKTKKTHHAR